MLPLCFATLNNSSLIRDFFFCMEYKLERREQTGRMRDGKYRLHCVKEHSGVSLTKDKMVVIVAAVHSRCWNGTRRTGRVFWSLTSVGSAQYFVIIGYPHSWQKKQLLDSAFLLCPLQEITVSLTQLSCYFSRCRPDQGILYVLCRLVAGVCVATPSVNISVGRWLSCRKTFSLSPCWK